MMGGRKKRTAMEGHLLAIKKDETEQDGKEGQLVYHPSSPSIRALGVRVAKSVRSIWVRLVGLERERGEWNSRTWNLLVPWQSSGN